MQTITLRDALAACRRSLADRTLAALAAEDGKLDPGFYAYGYLDENGDFLPYGCAIGVAMTAETKRLLQAREKLSASVSSIWALDVPIPVEDRAAAYLLQLAHDAWMNASGPLNARPLEVYTFPDRYRRAEDWAFANDRRRIDRDAFEELLSLLESCIET